MNAILRAATPLFLLSCAVAADALAQSAWRPERSVEMVVPAGPGGQNDLTVRNMHRVLQAHKLVDARLVVVNKGGGGGAVGTRSLSAAQVAYWEAAVANLVETEDWKKEIARNYSTLTRMNAAENREFLAKEYAAFQGLLTDLGMARK
jgi:tripartite-type tricarboxylate transporter receptor subunit TctC